METDLKTLKEQTENLKNQIEILQKQIKNLMKKGKEDYVLKLSTDKLYNSLIILYENKGKEYYFGYINHKGKCFILDTEPSIEYYNTWREHGMKVDNSIVEWLGGLYRINTYYTLERTDIINKDIYDFDTCRTISYCNDDNIMRFKHNNRPIPF